MDLGLFFNLEESETSPVFDLSLSDGELESDEGIRTAVIASLGTDRRALDSDNIPDGTDNPRGWFADYLLDNNDREGSRLWLLSRSKQTTATSSAAEDYVKESLAWMLIDGVASAVAVSASWYRTGFLKIDLSISRNKNDDVQFSLLWDVEAARISEVE